jgi:hypothetical protein
VASNDIMFIPSLIKIGQFVPKVNKGIDMRIRERDGIISLSFLIKQGK